MATLKILLKIKISIKPKSDLNTQPFSLIFSWNHYCEIINDKWLKNGFMSKYEIKKWLNEWINENGYMN